MEKLLNILCQIRAEAVQEIRLDPIGSWKETRHAVVKPDILSMIAAFGSERALLLTGDPGVGKSHLARVAAEITERYFISVVIKPDDEIGDLLYKIDHTKRLSDAQLAAALKKEFDGSLKNYLRPGPIWHAFQVPDEKLTSEYQPPSQTAGHEDGVVLLIDEIDKASVSLLNSLLEVLGNMSFEVSVIGDSIKCRNKPPLIIMTSNGDRDLPPALLRRCVCHEVKLPTTEPGFIQRMRFIAKAQMGENYSEKGREACAKRIFKQRYDGQHYQPGASEFVDMLHAMNNIAPGQTDEQINTYLPMIESYFLKNQG